MTEFLNNFDKNLLESSFNKEELSKAKEEWELFKEEKSNEKKTCICNHKIQHVRYYLNKNNGNIICCGSVCCKKFNLDKNEMSNKTLEKIFKLKNPYNEYIQFANIQEYLDYAKDELDSFIDKEIKLSKFNNLIIILENIVNINKSYNLNIFDIHIESIKLKLIELSTSYIEDELNKDIASIFEIMGKFKKLSNDYQIKKPDIIIFKNCIEKIVEHNIINYSGYTTPPLQKKFDTIIEKIEKNMKKTDKSVFLDFLINNNDKLKNKIQSIRDQNFAFDKAKYERKQEYERRMREKYPKKYYF